MLFVLFASTELPESTYKYELLGLNLLRLLAQNKLADFHTVCFFLHFSDDVFSRYICNWNMERLCVVCIAHSAVFVDC